jgi:hypothetical protein
MSSQAGHGGMSDIYPNSARTVYLEWGTGRHFLAPILRGIATWRCLHRRPIFVSLVVKLRRIPTSLVQAEHHVCQASAEAAHLLQGLITWGPSFIVA